MLLESLCGGIFIRGRHHYFLSFVELERWTWRHFAIKMDDVRFCRQQIWWRLVETPCIRSYESEESTQCVFSLRRVSNLLTEKVFFPLLSDSWITLLVLRHWSNPIDGEYVLGGLSADIWITVLVLRYWSRIWSVQISPIHCDVDWKLWVVVIRYPPVLRVLFWRISVFQWIRQHV